MTETFFYIRDLGVRLYDTNKTISCQELSECLNSKKFTTQRGESYKGGRGIYKLVGAVYRWLCDEGLEDDAYKVAMAFTKIDGSYAHKL